MTAWEQAYEQLNAQQRQAVDTVEGPVMVLAGPGTGKTQMLAVRVARILSALQVQPQNILVLSYTQAAAVTFQQRVVQLIGPAGYAVASKTFHGFCAQVIEQHPEFFPSSRGMVQAIDPVERFGLIESILEHGDFPLLRPLKAPQHYVHDIVSRMSQYKRENVTPLRLRQLAEEELAALDQQTVPAARRAVLEKQIRRNLELAEVMAEYTRQLAERDEYDFDDMILWVIQAFRDEPDLLVEYQEQYQYVLVDEFQDTNQAQMTVLTQLLAHWGEAANICVVGDPNQAIYRFQGASFANTLSFLQAYPGAAVITLQTGYRCGQQVYEAAAALIAHNTPVDLPQFKTLHDPLQGVKGAGSALLTYGARGERAEAVWVVEQIRALHSEGVAYEDCAIVVRKHRHAEVVLETLERFGIPTHFEVTPNALHEPLVQQLRVFLRAVVSLTRTQDDALVAQFWQLPWWDLPAQEKLAAVSYAYRQEESLWRLWHQDTLPSELQFLQSPRWQELRQRVASWALLDKEMGFLPALHRMLQESGLYRSLSHVKVGEQLHCVNALASVLRLAQDWYGRNPSATLEQFVAYLDQREAYNIGVPLQPLGQAAPGVHVLTAHGAKGKEWPHVFIMRANDQQWGNAKQREKLPAVAGVLPNAASKADEDLADERRLFYVALTRAQQSVSISWVENELEQGREQVFSPTQFLLEIPPHYRQSSDGNQVTNTALAQALLPRPAVGEMVDVSVPWLRSQLANFCLSVSALNTYLRCPLDFLYHYVLHFPELPQPALLLGTAVHTGLERYYHAVMQQVEPEMDQVFRAAEHALAHTAMRGSERAPIAAAAKTLLSRYVQSLSAPALPVIAVEQTFGRTEELMCEGVRLVGKIDRIDLLDEALLSVKVVDYKTGRKKSRNEILGKTKHSDGSLWRQLLFYKLLSELSPSYRYQVTMGEFLFVEPNDRGNYTSEAFDLSTPGLTTDLRQTIAVVAQELESLAFLQRPTCGECPACKTFRHERH